MRDTKLVLRNRVKELRTQKNMTQEEFARKCNTTQATISAIENEKYSPSAFLSGIIACVLDTRWEEIFYFEKKELTKSEKVLEFLNKI